MYTAITRKVSPKIIDCELTHMDRSPIDFTKAQQQHQHYVSTLKSLDVNVIELAMEPELADSVFVEDAAIVLDELAIISRPGAQSRRAETDSIKKALMPYRECAQISGEATLDGGDILVANKEIYAGLSSRTNQAGIEQLAEITTPFGYKVHSIATDNCLHLKTAVTQLSDDTLIINPDWIHASIFKGWKLIEVDANEPFAANALKVGSHIIYQPVFSKTMAKLEQLGFDIHAVDNSELAKAEAGLTCCSLLFKTSFSA